MVEAALIAVCLQHDLKRPIMKTLKSLKISIGLFFLLPLLLFAMSCGNQEGEKQGGEVEEYGEGSALNLADPYATSSQNKFSTIIGWEGDHMPTAPNGYQVVKFAEGLNSPRWIYEAPNGDIFVSQARTASKSDDSEEDEEARKFDLARNINDESAPNNILLFRDNDGDGIPEFQEVYLSDLNQPFGMLVLGDYFYVANTDGILRFPYDPEASSIMASGEKILDLPAGGYNNHWTRNIVANADGSKIFVAVGSASNVGEYGMDVEDRRACILEINPDGSGERIYGAGIRNPVAMDIEPESNILWTAVNERDELGDELVPDYITSVQEDGFYGWPYAYWGSNPDPRRQGERDDLVEQSIAPDYAVGSHTASLGMAFSQTDKFKKGVYIGQHGSWNRSEFSGYKVLFVPFEGGRPTGEAEDFLTGFIADKDAGEVYGRPVAVAFTQKGYMLVSDDAANVIFAVIPD